MHEKLVSDYVGQVGRG